MHAPPPPARSGLSQAQAQALLLQHGPNALETEPRRRLATRVLDMVREPMFVLLVAAAALYIALGDRLEGLTLSLFVLAMLGLTFWQEGRAESALQALRELTEPTARVLRDGQVQTLPARAVVPGDLLLIAEGERIAADGRLLQAAHLQVDESLLTGESLPVDKSAATSARAQDQDSTGQVFAACHVVRGQGLLEVTATGARSQVGQIGQALVGQHEPVSPLRQQTEALVQRLAWGVGALALLMLLVLGMREGQWLQALLSAIALAMALLPEEYPVVQTLFPALGARRLTREGVLARRISAVETLGAVTVLCTDKTGTLTENRMAVAALALGAASAPRVLHCQGPQAEPWSDAFEPLLAHAVRASAPEPFDPMEQALHRLRADHTGPARETAVLVQRYPLSPGLPAMAHVWRSDTRTHPDHASAEAPQWTASAKGAPEAMLALCQLPEAERAQWLACTNALAAQGLRVLGVAHSAPQVGPWPAELRQLPLQWLGLLALQDPLRAEAQRQQQLAERLERDRWPDPSVGVYHARERAGSEQLVGLMLAMPLSGRYRESQARAALAQAQALQERVQQLERELSASFEARWHQLGLQQQALAALRAAADTQQLAADKSLSAYTQGEHSMTELIQNRRLANEQRRSAQRLLLEGLHTRASLALDTHRLWDLDD